MTQRNPFPSKERKPLFLTLLKVMGAKYAEVAFAGGGDSGSIEGVTLMGTNDNEIKLDPSMTFEWESETGYHDPVDNDWKRKPTVEVMPVYDILVRICEDCLDTTSLDWYNNEGGQGQLTIDLTQDPPSIDLSVEINYTHTENHAFDFNEDEEEGEKEVEAAYCRACETEVDSRNGECMKCGQPTTTLEDK